MSTAKAITNDIVQNTSTQRTVFRVLIALLIILSTVYMYLIGSITFNVLARKTLDATIRTVGSHVSELELAYLAQTNGLDKAYASSLGFVDVQKNIYATRDASVRVALR